MVRDALRTGSARQGVSAQEIVDNALANVGIEWTTDGCTDLVWGVSNLAGVPFFDVNDKTTSGDPTRPQDVLYVVPHSPGVKSGTDNISGEGWSPAFSRTSAAELKNRLQPGDVVRVYKQGNPAESSLGASGGYSARFFNVFSVTGGDVQVVDNWNTTAVVHDDMAAAFAPSGDFQSEFVSGIDQTYADGNFGNAISGNGFGDFSDIETGSSSNTSIIAHGDEFLANTASG